MMWQIKIGIVNGNTTPRTPYDCASHGPFYPTDNTSLLVLLFYRMIPWFYSFPKPPGCGKCDKPRR
jgi:hypothetical protein